MSSLEKLFKPSVPPCLVQWWLFSFSPNSSKCVIQHMFIEWLLYHKWTRKGRGICVIGFTGVPILSCPGMNLISSLLLIYFMGSLVYSNLCEGRVISVYLVAFSQPNMVPGMHCAHNTFCGLSRGRENAWKESFHRLTCLKALYKFFLLRRCEYSLEGL